MAAIAKRNPWRKILYAVGITLGLALLAHQAWQGYQALRQVQACVVRPAYLLGALGLYLLAYFVQMAAWALIMRYLQAPLTPQAVMRGYALSFLPRYIPGSVWGYLSRNEWLAQTHGVGYATSTTASFLEAAMLLITAAVLGGIYWLHLSWQFPLLEFVALAVGIASSWLVWRLLPWLVGRAGDKWRSVARTQRQGLRLWAATLTLYAGFWLLQGAALVAITHTLCEQLALALPAATAAFALAWAIGFLIIFVPAGLGVREWTLSALLVSFAMLQPGQATLIALVSRLGLILAEVFVLLIGLQGQIRSWWRGNDWLADHEPHR